MFSLTQSCLTSLDSKSIISFLDKIEFEEFTSLSPAVCYSALTIFLYASFNLPLWEIKNEVLMTLLA